MKKLLTQYCPAFALLCCAALSLVFAQVPVHINSGNPAFPFPQFLPYVHPNGDTLHNIGTRNPAGVVHAEMERAGRDAYQIMMNRADYFENVSLGGTRYIKFRSNPDCSEGTGYAMLAAAMMADKTTFDGLWLQTHDYAMNKVTRYRDGSQAPSYNYSVLPGWQNNAGGNSAADGDFDIALALMIAHMQWGDDMGIKDSRGNNISYKDDFIKVARGLSDTVIFRTNGNLLSGTIGFDGYFKGGDSWAELTGWARTPANLASIGMAGHVEQPGPQMQHIDYTAPAYFRQFADYLSRLDSSRYAWNISQFRRAEASSDWLIGKLIEQNPRHIPVVGWVEMAQGEEPKFTNFSDGEDFRAAWRTILGYVWHGNPSYSWDPVRNIIVRNQSNTYLRDAGLRFSRFLWDRRQAPWNATNETIIGTGGHRWWGPSVLKYYYSPIGEELGTFPLNWMHGTGSPSAVTAQDFDLMAEMYRQCELEMDVETPAPPGGTYLDRTPTYFHGFFRLLGMLVLTGNHHAPLEMKRQANMKVYLDVDKTYVFENDTITYTIEYRNYGAEDASGVVVTNRLHNDMAYISSTGGGTYDASTNTVRWNVGSVPGYKSSMGASPSQTQGQMTLKVVIPFANLKRYENKVEITCENGPGWVSNEYPNKISPVMKTNGVDIARRALRMNHTVYRDTVNPNMTVTYTIDFENSAEAGWLNGGRPGVNFAYMHNGTAQRDNQHTYMLRILHDAHEPYIDYGNYRISYFMFDNNFKDLGPTGWSINTDIMADQNLTPFVTPRHEMMPPGQDARGRWNQRLIVQVADPERRATDTNWISMAAPTQHLITYYGMPARIARGGVMPYRAVWRMSAGNYVTREWGADWSFNSGVSGSTGDEELINWGFPVSPDFTESYDPDYEGKPVTRLHRKLTNTPPARQVENILVEEWDGYTWRRVAGNGPVPGREVTNVKIVDTLPEHITFKEFIGSNPMGVAPKITSISGGRQVITWEIDKLLVGEGGKIQYTATANDMPAQANNRIIRNRAWLSGDRESPILETAILVVTWDSLPPPPPEPTTLYKNADKETYYKDDTITYTIGYKQTHGYTETSSARTQWTGTGTNDVSSNGQTISIGNNNLNMYFNALSGTNVTLTGTLNIKQYREPITIFARNSSGSSNSSSVNISFKQEYQGVQVTVTSNGSPVGEMFTVAAPQADISMDYKFVFEGNNLAIWLGDTSAAIPYENYTVAVQAGYAGVRYTTPGYDEQMSITNWAVSTDAAYDVTIRDTIPYGVTYVSGSATGRINTGSLANRSLTGSVSNGVITWTVVSGADNPLGGGDSLTVTWKGVVDTAKNGRIVNTVYADLKGHPANSIGAQEVSLFASQRPQEGKVGIFVNPEGRTYNDPITISVSLWSDQSNAKIYYTICSSDNCPDPDSSQRGSTRLYDGPLSFNSYTTLKAIAYADGFKPSDVITHTYDIPLDPKQLTISADPPGGMYPGEIFVRLSSTSNDPKIVIYYTRNGADPVPGTNTNGTIRYDGTLISIKDPMTLKAIAVDPTGEFEQSNLLVHDYNFLSSVPAQTAIFFDNVGDGLAHGVKLVFAPGRALELDVDIINRYRNDGLVKIEGLSSDPPSIESVTLSGDTLLFFFRGDRGVLPTVDAQFVIRYNEQFDPSPGYISNGSLRIIDGVAPVLTDAIYYPSLTEGRGNKVAGDTVAMVFNKYARIENMTSATAPFVFSYSGGGKTYELSLEYVRHSRDTVFFVVLDVVGDDPVDVPSAGDMVRIKPNGEVSNLNSYGQYNENNTAVPLKISYPDLDYVVEIGPNPFRAPDDSLRIWISVKPYMPVAFDGLDPQVTIFDRMGKIVNSTDKSLKAVKSERDGGSCYVIAWSGYNHMGRMVGTGTYLAIITMKNPDGQKKTVRQKVYVRVR